jgi:dTMP kinase
MSDPERGRFVTFEGGEGAGKTTQLKLLSEGLQSTGLSVLQTREPGGSAGAEEIRGLLVEGDPGRWDAISEALLHFAARRDHIEKTIKPALARGAWVLCDRFADSTMAYQGYGHGLERETIEAIQQLAIGAFKPDLTLILDVPVDGGLARAAGRAAETSRYERMDVEFHERVRQGFLEVARRQPERCVVIEAQAGITAVQDALRRAIADRLQVEIG